MYFMATIHNSILNLYRGACMLLRLPEHDIIIVNQWYDKALWPRKAFYGRNSMFFRRERLFIDRGLNIAPKQLNRTT